jgi:hypothetical protein
MPEKKDEKKQPLDMTTEEMANYLFPKKVVDHLNEVARGKEQPPPNDENGSQLSNAPTQEE